MTQHELPVTTEEAVLPADPAPRRTPMYLQGRRLELIAIGLMSLGAAMMFQPFAKVLYTYSFIVILLGAVMFTIVSHFPD